MSAETFLNGRVKLHSGDSRDVLKGIPDCSIDSIVTDPPYALVSIVKRFGSSNAAAVKVPEGGGGVYGRSSAGFMGHKWDTGDTAFAPEFWSECLRVLKPGGHAVAFSATTTFDQLIAAMKCAGFHLRDTILDLVDIEPEVAAFIGSLSDAQRSALVRLEDLVNPCLLAWLYGTGFAKKGYIRDADGNIVMDGWGGQLKPAFEPIVLARKPLSEGTVAANMLRWGTGALNIDGCRIEAKDSQLHEKYASVQNAGPSSNAIYGRDNRDRAGAAPHPSGRWPANAVHDGSDEVFAAFPETGRIDNREQKQHPRARGETAKIYVGGFNKTNPTATYSDIGSAARFFSAARLTPTIASAQSIQPSNDWI